ncbi:MAG TPA: DNA-formamidopyrimidine glycosylase family protein [Gaiellaceae bacterium]|nr:DNA-formamidopyrimidine glycosylase family protein [Gaiellaceae bacterium]
MPEGDSLHRAAALLQPLVGQPVAVETPHPRAAALRLPERLDGRRLERVEAVGKNLLLHFEGGLVLRNHLRMTGRWQLRPRGEPRRGRPWLVLRGASHEGVLWNGPVLELGGRAPERLGPDVLADPPDLEAIVANLRRDPARALGDALLDQRLVAGIGNLWKAESLWRARLSPWLPLGAVADEELRALLADTASQMRAAVAGARPPRNVYRRAGRSCPRCGEPIRSRGQGDANRTAYWCPACQAERGEASPTA